MTPIQDFARRVADKIRNKDHWTTGASAKDSYGFAVMPSDMFAVKWCVIGACDVIDRTMTMQLSIAYSEKYGRGMVYANDKLGHEAIIRDLDNL